MPKFLNYFLPLLLLGTISCEKLPKASVSLPPEQTTTLPEDFNSFYERFHADSNFQMSSIIFPLAGKPSDVAASFDADTFAWEAADWKLQKLFQIDTSDYAQEFISLNENFVTEIIKLKKINYGIERRFAKVKDKWMLVYYADMNEL